MKDLTALVKKYEDYLLGIRREFHQIPELRFHEEGTLDIIDREVEAWGERKPYDNTLFTGGQVYDFEVDKKNMDWIIFRADIDGLAVEEKTGLPFASKNPGLMHACGHDTHAAMLLTALKIICENDLPLKHNIRFVFQRAEENPIDGNSGGKQLVEESICSGVKRAYALHIWTHDPSTPSGTFSSRPGPMLGNSDRVKVLITAPGGHVAFPNQGSSALEVGLTVCQEMRRLSDMLGFDVSLAPAIFKSGESSNIRPQTAELWFACRNYHEPKKRSAFHEFIKNQINSAAQSKHPDAEVKVELICGHPALINDDESYLYTNDLLCNAGEKTSLLEKELGGEDFAHYLNQVPGCMWMLNAWQEGSGDHHTSTFNPDESVFYKGVLFWLLLATK